MIDLETLGTNNNAPVISVGIAQVNDNVTPVGIADVEHPRRRYPRAILSTLSFNVDFEDACRGAKIDARTVKWWLSQAAENPQAAKKLVDGRNCENVVSGCHAISNYLCKPTDFPCDINVWGNGSDFDIVILRNMFDRAGVIVPWLYHGVRCFRTVKALFPHVCERVKQSKKLVHHCALDDAIYQGKQLNAIFRHLNKLGNSIVP